MDYALPHAPLAQGLCVPAVTALDASGGFDARSQERLTDFLARGERGGGAQAVWTNSAAGEGLALPAGTSIRVTEAVHYALTGGWGPRLWAGISDRSAAGFAANLEAALRLQVSAVVAAPQATADVPDSVTLFLRHAVPLFVRLGKGVPVFLDEDPEAAARGRERLSTRELRRLARQDYVCGVLVRSDARAAGRFLKAARPYKARHEFGAYLGRAEEAFPLFAPVNGLLANLGSRWRRFWVSGELPQGVLPLSANLFPGAWRQAWAACMAGDSERMDAFAEAFGRLEDAFQGKGIACVKAALAAEGVLATARVAEGTPVLAAEEEKAFLAAYRRAQSELAEWTYAVEAAPIETGAASVVAAEPAPEAQNDAAGYLKVALDELGCLVGAYPLERLGEACALVADAEASGGRVHVTGVGKCEYVAGFIASSLSSTGTPAFFLHATEAGHGASGQVAPGDVVIAVSNSGETGELKAAVDTLKRNGARILGVSGRGESWLARQSEAFLPAMVRREGDELNLAPRNSVLAEILVLNALGVALQHRKGFTAEQFRAYHPGGSLGRRPGV
jgi:arabinose-5-phosphate isomerase